MCWHDTELITIHLLLPDCTYPPGYKWPEKYLRIPSEMSYWIPLFIFYTQCLCMAQPPALPVYDTSLADMNGFLRWMPTLFTFCAHYTSNCKNTSKYRCDKSKSTKTNVTLRKCEMYRRIDRPPTPLIGVKHTHTWPKGHMSHFGIKILVRWFCLHFEIWSCRVHVIFRPRLGSFVVITK